MKKAKYKLKPTHGIHDVAFKLYRRTHFLGIPYYQFIGTFTQVYIADMTIAKLQEMDDFNKKLLNDKQYG